MSKESLLQCARTFRATPGVIAAIEKLTPVRLSQDDLDDIEGDWLVAEVQLAKASPAERDKPVDRAHEMIRKLICHVAAQNFR